MERAGLPERRLVARFEFLGVPPGRHQRARHWWLLFRRPEVDVCRKNPGFAVDVTAIADLAAFTRVWLGHLGLEEARRAGKVALHGEPGAFRLARDLLAPPDLPRLKRFQFDHDDFHESGDAPPLAGEVAGPPAASARAASPLGNRGAPA
jgi:hypothetical protein